MFVCWECANETEYPFKFGSHGRAYCSETCFKGVNHASPVPEPPHRQPDDPSAVLPSGVHVETREGHP